ncbi:ImuA family protein [Desertivirga brevis]|uniref:ImuA family protein n=1 Tax=Desertivirga brevis TaxID=2810310 RepID=UPI001A97B3DA|nr:Error-prone repair protein ImuA [Pedobacter sp. SYSU D00873]
MELRISKKILIDRLQKEILLLEGYKPANAGSLRFKGLESIEAAFPNAVFPTGTLHEFVNPLPEQAASTSGFIAGLLSVMMQNEGYCLWISCNRSIFPPALKAFGVEPDRVVFIDLKQEKDILWATEEALKCKGLLAVIAEVREINFSQSRRLQLVMEASKVTGFVMLKTTGRHSSTACTGRWQITPIASEPEEGLPGLGFPRWNVELLKVRNGNPGSWRFEWSAEGFKQIVQKSFTIDVQEQSRKAG